MHNLLNRFFKLDENNTTIKREVIAGITTFFAVNYVLIVTPITLGSAGMDTGAVFTMTAVSVIVATLLVAVFANYPVAVAPGLGMQAFFTYTIVLGMGYSWQEGLFATFLSGFLLFVMSVTKVRQKVINAIPIPLKYGLTVSIGMFVAFIGLKNSGIIVGNDSTFVGLGNLGNPITLVALFGILLLLFLSAKKVSGSIFITMVVIAIAGVILQISGIDMGITIPSNLFSLPPNPRSIVGELFDFNVMDVIRDPSFWVLMISVVFVDFFDTAGTTIAVGQEIGVIDKQGEVVNGNKIFLLDSIGIMISAVFGITSTIILVESLTGVKAGGRTGLTGVVFSIGILVSLFLAPLLGLFTVATAAPALVFVGISMAQHLKEVDFTDFAVGSSVIVMILMSILTFSVAEGLGLGFIVYTVLMVAEGKGKELHPFVYILTTFFLVYFTL